MANLDELLNKYYGYDSFRPGQKEIISQILAKQNVLGILPTGTGKSICYELPARILPGITIVISPLIALMIDQVKQLKANGFKQVIALNSFLSKPEREMAYINLHKMKIIFISPELLQSEYFLSKISELNISLFVIDEAHCISTWGHDFRPDYLKIKNVIKKLNSPVVLALTATASKSVQSDIINALNLPNLLPIIYPINKENISLVIKNVTNEAEKLIAISAFLKQNNVPTLIYFSSRNACEKIAFELNKLLPDREISYYHGGMDPMDRITIQQQFMEDQLDIICCTNAFGMGINKANIRAIFHYHLPLQKETFIQEIGRAGRDGQPAVSILLHASFDVQMPINIIKNELPDPNQIKNIIHQIRSLAKINKNDNKVIKHAFLQGVDETHWRFIHYHLENNDIIINDMITNKFDDWEKISDRIIAISKERLTIKMQQLKSMRNWITENNCLRVKLYEDFQTTQINATDNCCSNCGFDLEQVKLKAITKKENNHLLDSWENKLAKLLLVGDHNETK